MLSLNQKSLILLIVLLIITPLQANIPDSKSYQTKGHNKQTFTANQFTTNKGTTNIDAKEAIELDIEKQQVEYQVEEQYQTTETYTEPDCTFFCTKTRTVTKTRTITKQRDETDEEAINRLIKTDPGKAWMATLISNKNKNKLTTNQITSINKDWDYNNSGLTDAAQLALTIAVSSFTGGLGIYSNAAGSLAGQASVASINSLGRGEGLENSIKAGITAATSEDALKGAFTSIFTAGANNSLGITGEGFANNMYRTGVSTTINTGINGGDLADNLLKAYTTALIDIGAKKGANWIGDRYALNSYTGGIGSANYWIHKGLHAGLGCATASAKGGDCASGATGAVVAEVIGEQLKGDRATWEISLEEKERIKLLSQLGAIGVAATAKQNVHDASDAGKNAVDNNLFGIDNLIGGIKGFTQEVALQIAEGMLEGKSFSEAVSSIDGGELLKATIADTLTSGIAGIAKINRIKNVFKKAIKAKKARNARNARNAKKLAKKNNKVTGPRGGKGTKTGKMDADGNEIIQRDSGGYYVVKNGKQKSVKSPNEHGNSLGNQPAERYKLVDRKTGKPIKTGETTHGENRYGPGKQKRYTDKELDNMGEGGARYEPIETGTKRDMYDKQNKVLERYKRKYGKYPPENKNGR